MGYYKTAKPEIVMNFFEQSITNDFIIIETYAIRRRLRINHLAKTDDGYRAHYSWHGWPHTLYGDLPEGQEFIILTPPYPEAKEEEHGKV